MMCREELREFAGPVVVVTGDSPLLQSDSVVQLVDDFRRVPAGCVMGTLVHENPVGLGRIVRDETGNFRAIVEEKDATESQRQIHEVNMSTYVFDCAAMLRSLDRLTDDNRQGEFYITDVPGIMLRDGLAVRALPVLKPCEAYSVNTVEDLQRVEDEIVRSAAAE